MKLKMKMATGLSMVFLAGACSSKQPIQKIDTELKGAQSLGHESMGKNSEGQYVLQKKESLATYLLDLQRDVYRLEEDIYGNKSLGNKGKYGTLEDCRIELRAKTNGKWEMVDSAPKAILSKEEAKITKKVGLDEKGQLVMLTEEELTARIKRFERYKANYERQEDWYDTEIKACKISLNNFTQKKSLPAASAEPVKFPDFATESRSDMNSFICQYVDSDASLKTLIKTAVGGGWILEDDLKERSYVNDETAKDSTDFRRSYVIRIGDWVLSYNFREKYGDLMNTDQDAELKAWLNRNPDSVSEKASCLPNGKRWSIGRK
ncbi:MAG: hypothetical protein KF789_10205 [Bdellovibrionaceae bacterium]|nr:hypothetical protein [Pseudobdellovibrionaceae bacterium]